MSKDYLSMKLRGIKNGFIVSEEYGDVSYFIDKIGNVLYGLPWALNSLMGVELDKLDKERIKIEIKIMIKEDTTVAVCDHEGQDALVLKNKL